MERMNIYDGLPLFVREAVKAHWFSLFGKPIVVPWLPLVP